MTPTEPGAARRVLQVDDDDAVRAMMSEGLQRKGFEVTTAASVAEALRRIATESFDVLITDLHIPDPGDGFTVVSAMRHSQPNALTMLVSSYPDVQSAMAAILLEADEIVVKPFEIGRKLKKAGAIHGAGYCTVNTALLSPRDQLYGSDSRCNLRSLRGAGRWKCCRGRTVEAAAQGEMQVDAIGELSIA